MMDYNIMYGGPNLTRGASKCLNWGGGAPKILKFWGHGGPKMGGPYFHMTPAVPLPPALQGDLRTAKN